ncbi:MAG: ACT domain-containing protein [Rhodocyclaceae bacterium]|nr:ACT domain-containing protein [Rhodocyclaceae bacterium]
MNTLLILTVIGDDRPGLVEALSRTISHHGGNWLESSMSRLAGKFAGIVQVSIPGGAAAALQGELATLPDLRITVEESTESTHQATGRRLHFTLVGQDRLGIVREVAAVLARHAVNVESLATHTESAPMSGETLFHAEAELLAGPGLNPLDLKIDLERLSLDLVVDFTLDEVRPG